MLPSLVTLLRLAAIIPLALAAPSPRGGRGGGGGGGHSGGSSGGGSGSGIALAYLGGTIAATSQNGYSIDGDAAPDAGYDASSTCTYNGGNVTTSPAWVSTMTGCLNALNGSSWSGTECVPTAGGTTFGFYKGENDYSDGGDCWKRCAGCLSSAIDAGQNVTTKCQYEYRTKGDFVGYKTHTCTMGYDAGS